ncbi:MAG: inner membrane CreD family protein [Lentisphaeria bacterium]|nr:inner membrane CreD family protein [Lentisphaeria bacterium]
MEETASPAPLNSKNAADIPELSPKVKNWIIKISLIIIALVVFQLPLYMVNELATERKQQSLDVQNEITENWGKEQVITLSPIAASTEATAEITPEIRYRGIYQTVVYTSKIKICSEYKNLPAGKTEFIKISDPKGILSISATINGKSTDFEKYLEFSLPQGDSKCEITLLLRGSGKLMFTPGTANNNIKITGAWDSPGFTGDILPEKRTVGKDNFSAEWNLSKFNNAESSVGVNLCISAGTYQQVERCFTYATFFLIVFFFTLLAAELITKVKVHPLQYLVASGAPVLFYLMVLAFSERIGFTAGYVVSSLIIVAMVTMYAKMFLGKMIPALVIGTIFAGSYLLNFVILQMEDLALMSGTIVLAVILAVLMALTGKINRNQDIIQ